MNKEQLKSKYGDERVLCVPRWYYETVCKSSANRQALETSIANAGYFDYRYEVEMDESVLQVIPYVVLKHGDKYFVTMRLGGDERLQGMVAFLGGHVEPCDIEFSVDIDSGIKPIWTMLHGLTRELREETTLETCNGAKINFKTVFVDNSSQVSRCHVCQLVIVEVDTDDIEIRETDKLEGAWVTLDELNGLKANGKTESWCGITIDLLNEVANNG